MRILSQDALRLDYDIPYEQACLNISKKSDESYRIYAWHILSDSDNNCFLVAEYSTVEKAQKAMEMLRDAYVAHFQFKNMTEEQKALFLISASEKESENIYGLFQFPTDDKIKV